MLTNTDYTPVMAKCDFIYLGNNARKAGISRQLLVCLASQLAQNQFCTVSVQERATLAALAGYSEVKL